jgi:chromosome segregation ATPase
MKAFLVNLLVILSVILCGFNAVQWYREAKLHGKVLDLGNEIYRKSSEVQSLQQELKASLEERKRLEEIRETRESMIRSNRVVVTQLQEESAKFERDAKFQTSKATQLEQHVEQYRSAFDKANDNLKKQNEVIQVQNEKMKQLADDRNEMVGRFNKLATDYKSIGDDYAKLMGMYTNLVAQVQAANQKPAK